MIIVVLLLCWDLANGNGAVKRNQTQYLGRAIKIDAWNQNVCIIKYSGYCNSTMDRPIFSCVRKSTLGYRISV